jgi:hypothetical protein
MFPVSANLGVNTEWVNINNRYTNSFYYFKGIHLKDSDGNTIAQYNPVFGFGYHELSITPDSYYQTITIPTGAQGNFVTLDTDQIIRSNKVFTEFTTLEKDILIDLAPTIDPSDKSGTFVIDCNDVRPLAIATDTAGNCNLFNFNRHPTCPDRTTLPTSSSPSNEYATARQVYKAMTVVTVSATEPTDKKAGDI